MSFKLWKVFGPSMVHEHIIDNSDTVIVGDMVKLRNGNLEVTTAGGAVHGVIVDIVDKKGNSISGSVAEVGSATVTGAAGQETVVVAADNETVDLIACKVETSKYAIFSGSVTGTMNTTSSSNKAGGWVSVADQNDIDETTHSRTITDVRELKNWGADPDDSSRMLVSINHSEAWDNGAAMA